MGKKCVAAILSFMVCVSGLVAEECATEERVSVSVEEVSRAFGHLIGKSLSQGGAQLDVAQVIQGLQDASDGKNSPMTELEYFQVITSMQEQAFEKTSLDNLQKADEFLAKNSTAENITVVEPGKLQYRIEREGSGDSIDENSVPLFQYTGKLIDGSVFGASKEEELMHLDETIPGFRQGVIGMREGERRTLYVHPDFGYGTSGIIPPNSLLVFEVDLVKATPPARLSQMDGVSTTPELPGGPEMASHLQPPAVVR